MLPCALGNMATAADGGRHGPLNSLKVAAGLKSEPYGQFLYTPFGWLFREKCDCNTSAECYGMSSSYILIHLILDILAGGQ